MSGDAELGQIAQQDLVKLDSVLGDLIADASRLLLPGRDFDANNSLLEVHAGELLALNFCLKLGDINCFTITEIKFLSTFFHAKQLILR